MKPKKHSTNKSKPAKSRDSLQHNSSNMNNGDKPGRHLDTLNLLLTVVSVVAALVSTYFAWQSFQKSLPKEGLEDWDIASYQTDKALQLTSLAVQVTISNIGGAPVSLVKSNAKLSYQSLTPSPTFIPASTPVPGVLNIGPITREIKVHEGLDLQGGLQVLLNSDIITDGNTRIVVQLPGISNPDEAIKTFGGTGLLEFIDAGDLGTPKTSCIGGACYAISQTRKRDVLAYVKGSNKFPPNGLKEMPENAEDDLPISFNAGESKVLIIMLRLLPVARSMQPTEMDILLQFNDGNQISIPLLQKLK